MMQRIWHMVSNNNLEKISIQLNVKLLHCWSIDDKQIKTVFRLSKKIREKQIWMTVLFVFIFNIVVRILNEVIINRSKFLLTFSWDRGRHACRATSQCQLFGRPFWFLIIKHLPSTCVTEFYSLQTLMLKHTKEIRYVCKKLINWQERRFVI